MKKQILSLALAAALLAGMTLPVAADNPTYPSAPNAAAGTNPDTVFNGTIKATILSATVPTAVAFDIDPTKEATIDTGNKTANQITQPADIHVDNHSVVPISLSINKVAATTANLVNASASLTGAKALMFTVKATPPENFNTAGDWLTTATKNFNVLAANTCIGAGKRLPVQISGQTNQGWRVNDTFSVTTTFVIGAVAAGPAEVGTPIPAPEPAPSSSAASSTAAH